MIYVSMINLIQSELFGILWNSKIDHTTIGSRIYLSLRVLFITEIAKNFPTLS